MVDMVDPDSPRYATDYVAGWLVGERGADGALDRADARNVSHAWYDGYHDAAAGRPKWTWRRWRRNGPQCDSGCAVLCDGIHTTTER